MDPTGQSVHRRRFLQRRVTHEPLTPNCNAGVTTTNQIGDLSGYGTVWYHPDGIANILSLSRVKEQGYRVTYDSDGGNRFMVEKSDGTVRVFNESERGLYYLDTSNHPAHTDGGELDNTVLINTVADNRSNYTNRAYSRASLPRKIQQIVGRPSTKEYIQIVERNLLPNCPITRDDIMTAEKIFGPDIGILKGKTVRKGAPHVEVTNITVPSELMSQYRDVIVGADIMIINKLPFFVTMSRNIKFSTAELLLDQKQSTLVDHVKRVQSIYLKRGFRVSTFLMDGQFDKKTANLI